MIKKKIIIEIWIQVSTHKTIKKNKRKEKTSVNEVRFSIISRIFFYATPYKEQYGIFNFHRLRKRTLNYKGTY